MHGIEKNGGEHAKILSEIEESTRKRDELVKQVDDRSGDLEAFNVWIAEERSDLAELTKALARAP